MNFATQVAAIATTIALLVAASAAVLTGYRWIDDQLGQINNKVAFIEKQAINALPPQQKAMITKPELHKIQTDITNLSKELSQFKTTLSNEIQLLKNTSCEQELEDIKMKIKELESHQASFQPVTMEKKTTTPPIEINARRYVTQAGGIEFEIIEFLLLKQKGVKITFKATNKTSKTQYIAICSKRAGGTVHGIANLTTHTGNEYRLIEMLGIGLDLKPTRFPTKVETGSSQTYSLIFRAKDMNIEQGKKFSLTQEISLLNQNSEGEVRRSDNGLYYLISRINVLMPNIEPF